MTYDGVTRLTAILVSIGIDPSEFQVDHAPPTNNEAVANFTQSGCAKAILKEAELKAAGLRTFNTGGLTFSVALPGKKTRRPPKGKK